MKLKISQRLEAHWLALQGIMTELENAGYKDEDGVDLAKRLKMTCMDLDDIAENCARCEGAS